MSTDRPETHPLIHAAKQGLNDFEKLLEDARDVLFDLAQDITNNVPHSFDRAVILGRIHNIRKRL